MLGRRVFFLSPASTGGKRADLLFSDRASFPLAERLRTAGGAPLGDVFSFLSGLYFRGKLEYARAFASPPPGVDGVLIITSSRGLVLPDTHVGLDDLREFAGIPIDEEDPRYAGPLLRDARAFAAADVRHEAEVVLLGSVASEKYVGVLGPVFGDRLMFPTDFAGRGDMSRGGLMLRAAREPRELAYAPVLGAVRHGPRPARLSPVKSPRSQRGPAA